MFVCRLSIEIGLNNTNTVNPNRTVSLSKFSFFKLLHLLIRSYQVPVLLICPLSPSLFLKFKVFIEMYTSVGLCIAMRGYVYTRNAMYSRVRIYISCVQIYIDV